MTSEVKTCFGLRDGKAVTLHDLKPDEYGLRCNLKCPNCGKQLEAVRRNVLTGTPEYHFLRHQSDEATSCPGYGDRSCHMLAEQLLRDAIGETIILPAVGVWDEYAHASKYTETGRLRAGIPEIPFDFDSDKPLIWKPGNYVPNLMVRKPVEATIIEVQTEHHLNNGLIPDAMLTLKVDDIEFTIAFEIRYAHAKTTMDALKYQELKMPVLECLVRDIDAQDENSMLQLHDRLLGRSGFCEWLYHPKAREWTDQNFRLSWSGERWNAVEIRHIAKFEWMNNWKTLGKTTPPDRVLHGMTFDKWGMMINIGIDRHAATNEIGSIYAIDELANALKKTADFGKPQYSNEDWEEAAQLDVKRGHIDLTGLRVMTRKCWKCHKQFMFWLLGKSEKNPSSWRIEERAQVEWAAIQKAQEVFPKIPPAGFVTVHMTEDENKTSEKNHRSFACPYCWSDQFDWKLFAQYRQILDIEFTTECRRQYEREQLTLQARLQQIERQARARQLNDRITSMRTQTKDMIDWVTTNAAGKMAEADRVHWEKALDSYRTFLSEIDLLVKSNANGEGTNTDSDIESDDPWAC